MEQQETPVDGEHRVLFSDAQRWHDNGELMDEGHWVHGKRSGEWKHYAKDGSLRKTDKHPDRG